MADRENRTARQDVRPTPTVISLPADDDAARAPARRTALRRPLVLAAVGATGLAVLAAAALAAGLRDRPESTPAELAGLSAPDPQPLGRLVEAEPAPSASPSPAPSGSATTEGAGTDPATGSGARTGTGTRTRSGADDESAGAGRPAVNDQHVVAPPVPTLAVYLPSPGALTSGADQRASLRTGRIAAGSGEIASVRLRHSGGTTDMEPDGTGRYTAVVTGLTNGTRYSFTVRVCNTDKRCTDSASLGYTPYGSPRAGTVTLGATGTEVTVSWTASNRNSFPFEYDCTVVLSSSPEDDGAPSSFSAGRDAGSRSFTGTAGTTYQAHLGCGNGRTTSVSRSAPVQLPATG